MDFGFAKPLGTNGSLADLCGSPSYVAPEVLRKEPYNVQCDLWSLGVVMFACLFGHMPFAQENMAHRFSAIKKGEFSQSRKLWG